MDGTTEDSTRAGPGDRLRNAREQRGESVGEVAARLRLEPGVIEALEANDYARLPAPIFVKGYLNAYCRRLALPADECVAEYERATDGAAPPPLTVSHGTGDGLESPSSRLALVSWLVAVVAVGMVVLWWLSRPTALDEVPPEPLTPVDRPADAEPTVTTPVVELEAETPVGADADIAPGRVPAAAEPAAERVPEPASGSEPESEPEPAVPPVSARFMFREESWTEIVDGGGDRLYFDLARAGTTVDVSGRPPLTVFLGNAPGVDVIVDGERFDHSSYRRRGDVARFTLGRAPGEDT